MKKRIVFIGAGKVAWHLSYALNKKGYVISGISSRNRLSAKRLASEFRANWTTKPEKIVKDADILFITTPDAEIKSVVKKLCSKGAIKKKQLVIHTSGLLEAKVLDCVKKLGALSLSIHPCFSFADRSYKVDEVKGVFFALEGTKETVKMGKTIVHKLGGKPFVIEKGKKPLYHLALVFASNFFVGIEDMAIELLLECGIGKKDAIELIKPLIDVTEKNIWKNGALKALTGPVKRGDMETLKKHLILLVKQKRSFDKIYKEVSKHLLRMIEKNGEVEKHKIEAMKKILSV